MASQEFVKNVDAGDVIQVRSALLDDLIVDKSFHKFNEELKYATQKMTVFEVHDGLPFEMDSVKWDKRYLNQQKAALMVNFSKERVEHIKNVITAVMSTESPEANESGAHTPPTTAQPNSRTGRTVVKTRPLDSQNTLPKTQQKPVTDHKPTPSSADSASGKTGRQTVSEKELPVDDGGKSKNSFSVDYKAALIVGGAAVSVAGVVLAEPIVIGTGAVIAGAGCILKATDKR